MKGFFKRVVAVSLATIGLFCTTACDMGEGDLNDVIDNVFKNYKEMNQTETGEYKQFKNINVDSSYLGYGYDVINDPYMDKDKINFSAPILDTEKIQNAKLKMVKENKSEVEECEGSTIEKFYLEYSTSLNVYGKTGKMFSGGLKGDFSGSEIEQSYWYLYKNIYNVRTFNIYMTNTLSEIQDMLSDEFKSDLLSMPASSLFDKYGTHMIKEAAMGGRMEISSSYSVVESTNVSSIQTAVNAHVKYLKTVSTNVETGVTYENALNDQNIQWNTKIQQFGGVMVDAHSCESLAQNYDKWVTSFDESLENSVLSGVVGENSLLGIWELLPEGNETRAKELEDEFAKQSNNSYQELKNRFKLKDAPDTSWKTLSYNLNRVCTLNGGQYNPKNLSSDQGEITIHDNYEMGRVLLDGCVEQDGKLKINSRKDFSITYQILQDINNLPLGTNASGAAAANIVADTDAGVYDTNIKSAVGMGAYYVRVTYTDHTQDEFNAVDIMRNKSTGSTIQICQNSQLNKDKTVEKIELVLVYEIFLGAPGFLGIWWKGYSNWRCTRTFEFI